MISHFHPWSPIELTDAQLDIFQSWRGIFMCFASLTKDKTKSNVFRTLRYACLRVAYPTPCCITYLLPPPPR